jgi:hypothetical protein
MTIVSEDNLLLRRAIATERTLNENVNDFVVLDGMVDAGAPRRVRQARNKLLHKHWRLLRRRDDARQRFDLWLLEAGL